MSWFEYGCVILIHIQVTRYSHTKDFHDLSTYLGNYLNEWTKTEPLKLLIQGLFYSNKYDTLNFNEAGLFSLRLATETISES